MQLMHLLSKNITFYFLVVLFVAFSPSILLDLSGLHVFKRTLSRDFLPHFIVTLRTAGKTWLKEDNITL
jgi:hypothetical protein